jgi:hydrogenase maturation protease
VNEWEWQLLEEHAPAASVRIGEAEVKPGDRVRLRPHAGGDIFDLALAGQIAIVESIEQDYEGKLHLAVVIESDPGKDLGILRQPGHRFFFTPQEIEPLGRRRKVLVAGIGNIFLGDDGFGVEVIRRLGPLPESVTVKDFGIRGYDLAYALLEPYDLVILVDAAPGGAEPGSIYVIEPSVEDGAPEAAALDAHAMNPVSVLRLALSMGPVTARILLVACEPESLGGDEGRMELSATVAASVDEAARTVARLVTEFLETPEFG